jgi:MYXO-CTERM domain-containing protein
MKWAKRCSLTVLGVAAVAWSSRAQAEEEFPSIIGTDLSLTYQVPCSVCHLKENTGAATARTPFALSLKARGFEDRASLTSALDRLKADNFDSDGDGVSDVAELQRGTDPNSPADADIIDTSEPGYGCGGSAPQGRSMGQAFVGVAALGWLLSRRRREQR